MIYIGFSLKLRLAWTVLRVDHTKPAAKGVIYQELI